MKVENNNPKMAQGAVRLAPSILAADFARPEDTAGVAPGTSPGGSSPRCTAR
jgi:hypothetical protein